MTFEIYLHKLYEINVRVTAYSFLINYVGFNLIDMIGLYCHLYVFYIKSEQHLD